MTKRLLYYSKNCDLSDLLVSKNRCSVTAIAEEDVLDASGTAKLLDEETAAE